MIRINPPIILLLLFIFLSLVTAAQNISGTITDTTNKKDVSNAVAAILKPGDSTLYKFVRTDKEGAFVLKNIPAGKYILMITHPSYADLLDDVTVSAEGLQLNKVSVIPKSKLMQELIIKSGSPMRIKGDTTIFTADSFKVSANANVEELLKKLPGIQVDKDGKIKAMGETVEKVLVDGEEFFGDDPGMAVKNLRADAVKEVQVYDKKSDQAEFTGIDDGKTKKTINLKLKDDRKKGYFGKIDLSGGIPDQKGIDKRYNNNLLLSSFKGKRKIAGYFLNGNTGQDGLNWQDNEKFGGENDNFSVSADDDGGLNFNWQGSSDDEPYVDTQNGLFKNNNVGLQYGNKWKDDKQAISFSPKYSYLDYLNSKKTFTQTQVADSFFNDNAVEDMHVKKQTFKLKAVYDVKIDSLNSLKITAKFNDYNTESQSYRTSINTAQSGKTNNTSLRDLNTNSDKQALSGNLLFKHKFKKIRRTFSLSADWNTLNTNSKSFLKSDNEIYTDGMISFSQKFDQQTDYDKTTKQFLAKAVYTEPLGKKYSLQLDYEVSIGKGKNDQTTYSYSPVSGKYDEQVDSLTNSFDQRITVNKPGFKINYNYKKLKFNIGTGIGFTKFNLLDQTLGNNYKRNYTNFFPTANLTYSYKSGHNLRFYYNGNTTQPRIDQLQLLRNNNDFFNQYLGNPLLRPSFTNNFNISHQSYDFIKDFYIYQDINFSQTTNAITDSRTINSSTGKTTSQPVNTDGNYNLNFYGGGGFKIKKANIRVDLGPNVGYNHSTEIINGSNNVSKNLNAGFRLYLNKSKDKAYDITVNNNFNYNSNSTQQFNTKIKFNTNETGINATYYLKKVWSLQSDFNYFVRQKTPQFQNNLSNQLWNAKLQRTLKKDEYTLYFSVRDILNQNTGIDRSFNSNTLSEVRNDRLKRYWMLGFTWNFKNKTAAPAPATAK
jgi:Outer membrane protein beta-barrel family/Carboxypeptidase regulatory-like domain